MDGSSPSVDLVGEVHLTAPQIESVVVHDHGDVGAVVAVVAVVAAVVVAVAAVVVMMVAAPTEVTVYAEPADSDVATVWGFVSWVEMASRYVYDW